jgi:hypothetical protein
MKKLALVLIAGGSLLSGCVAYDTPVAQNDRVYYPNQYPAQYSSQYPGRRDSDRDGIPNRYDRDRDGDGVPNRYDQRPDDPRRY